MVFEANYGKSVHGQPMGGPDRLVLDLFVLGSMRTPYGRTLIVWAESMGWSSSLSVTSVADNSEWFFSDIGRKVYTAERSGSGQATVRAAEAWGPY